MARTGAFARLLSSERQHQTAVAAPVRRDVRNRAEAVGDPVVKLVLVLVLLPGHRSVSACDRHQDERERVGAHRIGVALRDTLGDDLLVALGVASVLAVLALHAGALEEELATERAEHDRVELLLHKLVPVLLVDRVLALADGALTAETTGVVRALPDVRLDCE